MNTRNFLLLFLLFCSYFVVGQTVNSDTYIKNTTGSYWVYNNGTNILNNKNTGAAVIYDHLKIADNGSLNINPQTSVTVSGNLLQGSGNDKIIIKSNASGTASLITLGSVIGKSKAERFLDADNTYGWTISSPVRNATQNIFDGHINTYFYNPLTPGWEAFSGGTMQIMLGYWTKFNNDVTIGFSDTLNTGNISFNNLYRTGIGTGNFGWNFLGNPYPSAIDWNEVVEINGGETGFKTTTKLNNAVCISNNNGAYNSFVGGIGTNGFNGIIPANAGFWTQVNVTYYDSGNPDNPIANAKLELKNTVRVHENMASGLKKTNYSGLIRLFAQRESHKDEIIIRFLNNVTLDFDPAFDAFKMFAEVYNVPQLYMTLPNNDKLSIYSLPEDLSLPHLIPLGVKSMANEAHTFKIDLSAFEYNLIDVHLEDKVTGTYTDMRLNSSYSYYALSDDENQRFVLHLGALSDVDDKTPDVYNVYAIHNNIYVAGLTESVALCVFNMLGQQIHSIQLLKGSHILTIDAAPGLYIVRITGSNKMESKKVFLD